MLLKVLTNIEIQVCECVFQHNHVDTKKKRWVVSDNKQKGVISTVKLT